MMVKEPLVSVIIPTYKREPEFVLRAIRSVSGQTYKNIEIIVVDDSPTEYSLRESVKENIINLEDDRIIYIQNPENIGGALSRNVGIERAQGEYITFLDDDDEYLSDKIETQLKFMLENDTDLSFSEMVMYNNNNMIVDIRKHKIKNFDNEFLLRYHLCHHMTGTPTFMFKGKALRDINGFDDAKVGQEFFLMLKAIEKGLKISYMPECHVKVYKHEGECISSGLNKIVGEKNVYNYKKRYFRRLSLRERMYIRFRYWVVMAVAYARNKMYAKMFLAGVLAVLTSPIDFLNEGFKYLYNIFNKGEK